MNLVQFFSLFLFFLCKKIVLINLIKERNQDSSVSLLSSTQDSEKLTVWEYVNVTRRSSVAPVLSLAASKSLETYLQGNELGKVEEAKDVQEDSLLVDWNNEFQSRIDDLKEALRSDLPNYVDKEAMKLKAAYGITKLVKDFEYYAETYAKIIISERFIPEGKRTIHPVTLKLKGFAGGEKYIAYGILFKFITGDFSQKLYGTDENASKSISLDLLGCSKVLESWNSKIRVPIMMTISYR
jgi:hypothetical protein